VSDDQDVSIELGNYPLATEVSAENAEGSGPRKFASARGSRRYATASQEADRQTPDSLVAASSDGSGPENVEGGNDLHDYPLATFISAENAEGSRPLDAHRQAPQQVQHLFIHIPILQRPWIQVWQPVQVTVTMKTQASSKWATIYREPSCPLKTLREDFGGGKLDFHGTARRSITKEEIIVYSIKI
jgi:hypothetical protein